MKKKISQKLLKEIVRLGQLYNKAVHQECDAFARYQNAQGTLRDYTYALGFKKNVEIDLLNMVRNLGHRND